MKPFMPLTAPVQQEADRRWQAFVQALDGVGQSVPKAPDAVRLLKTTLAFSGYAARVCSRYPTMAAGLLEGDLTAAYGAGDMYRRGRAIIHGADPAAAGFLSAFEASEQSIPGTAEPLEKAVLDQRLRWFRHREMLRIAVRDIAGLSDLAATLADLSDLAAISIDLALDCLTARLADRFGHPRTSEDGGIQQLVVLAMGKLGAGELNFSSDVDLVFAYEKEGRTDGAEQSISNEEFFLRLARELIQAIGGNTADGFVFRVDTRLRPYGESGPLVMSFDKMEDYYHHQGREWERYALIKARAVAGDRSAGHRLLKRLNRFVFRRYLDYGVFDALRDMKHRIALEVRKKGLADNIKLGFGGIREIEFFGQVFQLIRGGVQPALQARPILTVISRLVRLGYIPAPVAQALTDAYDFLRRVENRLQQIDDQQTHQLPDDPFARQVLALAMGFDRWDIFAKALADHRHRVQAHFEDLLHTKDDAAPAGQDQRLSDALFGVWQGALDAAQGRRALTLAGFCDADKALSLIDDLRKDRSLRALSAEGRNRLDRLMPKVLVAVGGAERPDDVLVRMLDLIRGIQRRTAYLSLLIENPAAIDHLVNLMGASSWIADFVARHPVLLDELMDPRTLYRPPSKKELSADLARRLESADWDDVEFQMEALRVFKQVNVLRVAASDITHVLPLMRVSDVLADIAEVILDKVVSLSWGHLVAKHGTPTCHLGETLCQRGFAVVAYGKLGGLELGYGSDLDLVFLHAADRGQTRGGGRPIDNGQFFARLGQRVLHLLSTQTAAGILYETDMRLRPSGDSGLLVSHIDGFYRYQLEDAWQWEHQALIRARAVTGDPILRERFEQIRAEVLCRRPAGQLQQSVADMRRRLAEAATAPDAGRFDLKQGPGGIVDIEFLVQYLVLRFAHAHPGLSRWTDNVRLLQALNEVGVLDDADAFGLRRAYLIYRAMTHRLNLRAAPAHIADDRFCRPRQLVGRLWKRWLGD